MFKNIAKGLEPSLGQSLSSTQFYSSISKLKRANLIIILKKGNYEWTSLGKVSDAIAQIEMAVSLSSYLKAWDTIASQDDVQDKQSILRSLI
jgi:hypothetical protein